MTPRTKSILQYAFSALLTLVFLYFAFRGTDFEQLWSILRSANYWWALGLLPPLLLSHLLRAWRWAYLLRPIKSTMRFRNLVSALMVGYLMNNVLPKVGELVRPYAIGKLESVSRSAALGTLIVERILDVLCFLLLIAIIPLVYTGPLLQTFPWIGGIGVWVTVATLSVLAVFTFLMARRDVVEKLLAVFTRRLSDRRAKLVEHIAHSFLDGFLFLKSPRHYVTIAVLSLAIWGLYVVMMYIPFYAFDLPAKYGLDLRAATVVQAISSLGYMTPTPGATGPFHYFVVQTLTRLYGVDDELARSYATVTHAVGYFGITLVGIYFFWTDKLHTVTRSGAESAEAAPSTANAGRGS